MANSGQLPLVMDLEGVVGLEVGGLVARHKLQRPLDSYQEDDLMTLREVWAESVEGMKESLDAQIHGMAQEGKNPDMEQSLLDRKNCVMEELNQAVVPREASQVLGIRF